MSQPLDVGALRRAIYTVSTRHEWATTTDTRDRTEEIAAEYAIELRKAEVEATFRLDGPFFRLLDRYESAARQAGYTRRDAPEVTPRYNAQVTQLRVEIVQLIVRVLGNAS